MGRHLTLEQKINKAIDNLIKRSDRNYEAYLWAFYRVIRERLYPLEEGTMSASNEWTEWHLTPRGWERGSEKMDGSLGKQLVDPPVDRVLTMQYFEWSGFGAKVQKGTNKEWRSDNEEEIQKLLKQFGECPHNL